MAATIGVPLYACGGGTIPLIREWLAMGMRMGSAGTQKSPWSKAVCFLYFLLWHLLL